MRRHINLRSDTYIAQAQSAVFSQSEITSILTDINIIECLCDTYFRDPLTILLMLKSKMNFDKNAKTPITPDQKKILPNILLKITLPNIEKFKTPSLSKC